MFHTTRGVGIGNLAGAKWIRSDPFRPDVNPSGSVNERVRPDWVILRAGTDTDLKLGSSVRSGVIIYIYIYNYIIYIL
jgi:hypothetical protein